MTTATSVFVPTGRPVRTLVGALALITLALLAMWWTGFVSPRIGWGNGSSSTYNVETNLGTSTVSVHNGGPLTIRVTAAGVQDPDTRTIAVTREGQPFAPFNLGAGESVDLTVSYGSERCRTDPTQVWIKVRTPSGLSRKVQQHSHVPHLPKLCSDA